MRRLASGKSSRFWVAIQYQALNLRHILVILITYGASSGLVVMMTLVGDHQRRTGVVLACLDHAVDVIHQRDVGDGQLVPVAFALQDAHVQVGHVDVRPAAALAVEEVPGDPGAEQQQCIAHVHGALAPAWIQRFVLSGLAQRRATSSVSTWSRRRRVPGRRPRGSRGGSPGDPHATSWHPRASPPVIMIRAAISISPSRSRASSRSSAGPSSSAVRHRRPPGRRWPALGRSPAATGRRRTAAG